MASISDSKKRKRSGLDGTATAALDLLDALHGETVDSRTFSDGVNLSLSGFLHPMLARKILAVLSYVYLGLIAPWSRNIADTDVHSKKRYRCDTVKLDHKHYPAFTCTASTHQAALRPKEEEDSSWPGRAGY